MGADRTRHFSVSDQGIKNGCKNAGNRHRNRFGEDGICKGKTGCLFCRSAASGKRREKWPHNFLQRARRCHTDDAEGESDSLQKGVCFHRRDEQHRCPPHYDAQNDGRAAHGEYAIRAARFSELRYQGLSFRLFADLHERERYDHHGLRDRKEYGHEFPHHGEDRRH